jgi:predicted DNA-binding protein
MTDDKEKIAQVHIRMPVEMRDRLVNMLKEEFEYPPALSLFIRTLISDYLEGDKDA